MRVEREIAGIAYPFAAGVMAAFLFWGSTPFISHTSHILTLWAVIALSFALIISHRHQCNEHLQWGLIITCLLICGIFTGLNAMELKISALDAENPVSKAAGRWGMALVKLIDRIPFESRETGGMIKALLTGNRESLDPETIQTFRDSGASHILALSGLHLGILYAVISRLLALLGNSRPIRTCRSILTIVICGIYTLATGSGASITRALIFITVKEAAEMTGRHSSLKSVLAASLMLHLAFAPAAVTEVGFQLSYAAMFGIAYIYPHLKSLWRNDWFGLRKVWDSAALSISCQITTGPLAYYYFGTFPQYFLLTNLLAIPLAGLLIPVALLTLALSSAGCCPDLLIGLTEWITTTMTHALSIIASM